MDWADLKQKKLFKKFFEKTGIQLIDEPIDLSKWEEENSERLALEAQTRPVSAIPKLEKAIKEHPEIPSLKNFLYIAYMYAGKEEKADALLTQTLEVHPNYIFGVTNKVLRANNKEESLQVGYLLREPRDVREFEGYDKPVHISAFKNYQHAAAHYEILIDQNDAAVQRLETLMEVGLDQEYIDEVARDLAKCRIQSMQDRLQNETDRQIEVTAKQKVYLTEYTDRRPTLTHTELSIFYKQSTEELSEQQQKEIFDLPKVSLIADLENILEDSMKRWGVLEESDYEENTHEFTLHALYFLGALKAEGSLQKVLNLLRMDEDFADYWFIDRLEDMFRPTLYALGEAQLAQLQAFVLEENVRSYNKLPVCWVVNQVALHQPHRRAEVVQWFQTVFQTFLDNPDNEDLIDTTFLSIAVSEVINFRGIELLPLIEQLFEKDWIQENVNGDLEMIITALKEEPYPSDIDPLPENIHEYYSREYLKRKADRPNSEDFDALLNKLDTKGEKLISKFWSEMMFKGLRDLGISLEEEDSYSDFEYEEEKDYYDYNPVTTVVREGPKVGRNDPCPCGSGKKYKKCCLRK